MLSSGVIGMLRRRFPVAAKDRVADCWSKAHEPGFAGSGRRQIFAIEQHDFDPWRVAKTGHAVFREERVLDAPVAEEDSFEERAADGLHDCALHLVAQSVRIHDRTALPGFNHAAESDLLRCRVDGNLGAGGDKAAFVSSAGDAVTPPGVDLAAPIRTCRRRLEVLL